MHSKESFPSKSTRTTLVKAMDVESDDRLLMALPRAIEAAEADEKAARRLDGAPARGLKGAPLRILPIELASAMCDRRAMVVAAWAWAWAWAWAGGTQRRPGCHALAIALISGRSSLPMPLYTLLYM